MTELSERDGAAAFSAGALPPILVVLLWPLPGLTGAITADLNKAMR